MQGLHFAYAETPVLNGLDIAFEPGRLHGILGPNGSGKSTLLSVLAGHLRPSAGRATMGDRPVSGFSAAALARLCALVPQQADLNFPFTVFETVLMGRHPHIPRFSRPTAQDLVTVEESLAAMDLDPLRGRILADLSGGEQQRTAVARGLAQDTPVLLLDEPTSSMDIRHTMAAMTELQRLAKTKNRTVITILHDLNLAARFCDRVFLLDKGRVHAYGNVAHTLTPDNIHAVFGVHVHILNTTSGPYIAYI
nr:ABC transporter ATP-binding protein [Pseudodesulfovibrio sp. S3-i]